ncbi:MAG: Ldh family oxidoreductase, partial [Chloroflexota bacterium]|nr:Ldh family oxidoreductase [Chloroflexota bacterium]
MSAPIVINAEALRAFTARAFARAGVARDDAAIAADVLVAADLRGVESHGVARLHHYVAHLRQHLVACQTRLRVVRELPAALTIDAGNGVGMVAAHRAMQALPHDMMGVAMCNASPTVVPFG